jgi:micrococcal nuclease
MYEYNAQIINVIDGDTLDLKVDLGFYTFIENRFRLPRINTPELSTLEGISAKEFVQQFTGVSCIIQTTKNPKDKYGRFLAEIFVGGINLSDELIRLGYAKPWEENKKPPH